MTDKPVKPLPDAVLAALQGGKLLEAIKLLRARPDVSVKDVREMAEAHRALAHRQPSPPAQAPEPLYREGLSPGEVPRSEEGGRTLLIIVIAAVAAYLLFYR